MGELDRVAMWSDEAAAIAIGPGGELARWGPVDKPGRWASVTKLFTTYALLISYEEGWVDLDEPYGPPGSTVRHLLAHASGLPFEGSAPIAAPGEKRIYSNTGIDLIGDLVAERSRKPLAAFLAERICDPLGIEATLIDRPSQGLSGTTMGLARLAGEFFNPLLIDPDTWADATRVWYPDLGGVLPGVGRFQPLGWGLGFEVREEKYPHWTGSLNSPATVGHFGGSGSFLWYDPVAAVAVGGMSEREFGDWALDAWPEFFDEILIGVT